MSTKTEDPVIRAKMFGPTLDANGRIRACSKSQVKTHMLCPRKWYYLKVLKLEAGEKGKGAQESTESHDRLELYLKTGGDIRNGYEKHGQDMLDQYMWAVPWRGGPMQVEEPLLNPTMKTPGGVQLTGFFDAYVPGGQNVLAADNPTIIDHKFLKNFDYADDEKELAEHNPEPVFYMAWALTREPSATACHFRHHNHQKKGARKNRPVAITQSREQVFARMAQLGRYIDEDMQATAACKDVELTKVGDLSKCCKAFGGCEFLSRCSEAPHARFQRALQGDGDLPEILARHTRHASPAVGDYNLMSLMDDLDLGTAPPPPSGVAAAATPAASTPAPAAAAQNQVKPALKRLEAQAAVKNGVYMLPGGPTGKFKGVMDGKALFTTTDKQIVELDLDDLVSDLNGDPVTQQVHEDKKRKLTIVDVTATPEVDPKAGVIPSDAPGDKNSQEPKPATPAPTPAPTPTPAPAPKPTEVVATVTVAEAAGQTAPTPAPAADAPAPKKRGRPAKAATAPADGFILAVDCAATAGDSLDEYVKGLADALCAKLGIVDLRLAPKDSDAAFMGWRGLLAIAAKKVPPPAGTVLVGSSGDLADPVIEALTPMASMVFRGRR